MTDIDRYITDEVLDLAYPEMDDISAAQMRNAFRAALPGILARHRRNVLHEAAMAARNQGDQYAGLAGVHDPVSDIYIRLLRMANEAEQP